MLSTIEKCFYLLKEVTKMYVKNLTFDRRQP